MSVLMNVANEIGGYVRTATVIITGALQVAAETGSILFKLLCFLISQAADVADKIVKLLLIITQDFSLFIFDVFNTSAEVNSVLSALASSLINFIANIPCAVRRAAASVNQSVIDTEYSLRSAAGSALLFLKQFIILVGDGTLFAIQLIPSTLLTLLEVIVYSAISSCLTVCDAIAAIGSGVITTMVKIGKEITDIPLSSLLGLVLLFALAAALRLLFNLIRPKPLLRSPARKLKNAANKLKRFARHLATGSGKTNQEGEATKPNQDIHTKLLNELQREREEKLCVICQDRTKCIILLPCRHFCLCQTCMETLAQDYAMCPICRREVVDSLRVYV